MNREAEIVAALSQPEYDRILRLARSVVQVRQTLYGYEFEPLINYRDQFMAENTSWVSDYLGTESKIAGLAKASNTSPSALETTFPPRAASLALEVNFKKLNPSCAFETKLNARTIMMVMFFKQ